MKKIVALLLSLCMLIALATACQQTTTTTTTAAATTKAEATTTGEATAWRTFDNVTLTCFIQHGWYPIDSFTGHIADQIKEDTGITLDLTIAVDGGQLGLMIASGELLDLTYTDGYLDELSDASLCFDYDSLIEQYNVDWEISPLQRGNALLSSKDGKIYMIRNQCGVTEEWQNAPIGAPMTGVVTVRLDILEEMGNPKIETIADFEGVLAKVKTDYPDLYPHMTGGPYWGLDVWRTSFGVTYTDWNIQADGSYLWYATNPRYKNELATINKWYRLGYIPNDCFADSWDFPGFNEGKAFSSTNCTQNCDGGAALELAALNPEWIAGALQPLDYKEVIHTAVGWSGTFISKTCSNPEAAISYMQYMYTPYAQQLTQTGREGIDFVKDENGIPQFSDEWKTAMADSTHNQVFNPWLYFGGTPLFEGIARCASYPTNLRDFEPAYKILRTNYENRPWIAAARPKTDTDERNILEKMRDMARGFDIACCTAKSEAEFEAKYQEYMAALKSVGIDELTVYMNQKIPEMEKNYK